MKLVLFLCTFTMKTYNHYKILPIINHLIINAMRKIYSFLLAMLLPALAMAQTLPSYCEGTAPNNSDGNHYGLTGLNIAVNGSTTHSITGLTNNIEDLTSEYVTVVAPGDQITFTISGSKHLSWSLCWLYIDWNGDGEWSDTERYTVFEDDKSSPDSDYSTDYTITVPDDVVPGLIGVRFNCGEAPAYNSNGGDACTARRRGKLVTVAFNVIKEIPERTVTVSSADPDKGSASIEGADGTSVTSTEGVQIVATPSTGYSFVRWTLGDSDETYSTNRTFTYYGSDDASFVAHFGELTYPEMQRFYSGNVGQQNRYVKEVTTTGTQTPTVFSATTTAELPYTAMTSINATSDGAVIDKTANPIVIADNVSSFTMTFTVWSDAIDGNATEIGWTNQGAYIDWNRDGYFNGTNESYDSDGQAHGNSHFVTSAYTRTVTIPAGVAPGTYRMRVIYHEVTSPQTEAARTEWVSTFWDGDAPYKIRNGIAYDFDIRIVSSELENPRTVTVASEDEDMGSVAITNPATDEKSVTTNQGSVTIMATAAEGATFMNWTDAAGNVVSTDATYTYTGTEDASFTANFGYTVTATSNDDGSLTLTVDGNVIASGTVVPKGTVVKVVGTPNADKGLLSLTANGTVIENESEITIEENTAIVANFGEAAYTVEVSVIGQGTYNLFIWDDSGEQEMGTPINSGAYITPNYMIELQPQAAEGWEFQNAVFAGCSDGTLEQTADDIDEFGSVYCTAAKENLSITVTFALSSTAIDGIEADDENAPVEYFNLQGIRVNSDNLTPGVYVRRQGSKTTKVLVTGK